LRTKKEIKINHQTLTLGIAGAHRTGKTTLATVIAEATHLSLVKTNTTAVFQQYGLSPSTVLNFNTRLWIQHQIIEAAVSLWQMANQGWVTDRTPIDFMAYTVADIQGQTEVDWNELERYINRCFTVTNQLFTHLVLVPPAIPLKYEEGKATLNRAYIEHLNTLMLGLCQDERLHRPVVILRRETVNLEARMKEILKAVDLTAPDLTVSDLTTF